MKTSINRGIVIVFECYARNTASIILQRGCAGLEGCNGRDEYRPLVNAAAIFKQTSSQVLTNEADINNRAGQCWLDPFNFSNYSKEEVWIS